jgi:hypothetical protein
MALAFSVTRIPIKYAAGYKVRVVRITLDTDYPASGWPIAATDVGLTRSIAGLIPSSVPGFTLSWDQAAGKLWAHMSTGSAAAHTEATTGLNGLDGLICTALVIGD